MSLDLIYLFIFVFFMSTVVFCINRKHVLLALLSLEFIVLSIYLSLFYFLMLHGYEMYFVVLFLVFSVCEGALGLSVLVNFVRLSGNDYLSSISLLSW
uniref:NADH-ubiquinone oxidoreductase chain 4L n=1 Tax=Brachyplatys subaeneus TaxID=355284 RepID=A0A2P1CMG2_9HEMI|nr:NADH dehydrogenase subunit 4L [Brachyplatys subaeneus]AVJ52521.1 NADH dehydrogenase subunit 4L [Brachyplatys subaeneus]UCC45918.1 NADH dehydrogenase subunit 4L [Brachyplatys subaeneus]